MKDILRKLITKLFREVNNMLDYNRKYKPVTLKQLQNWNDYKVCDRRLTVSIGGAYVMYFSIRRLL